ncbi:MAG: dienelactone hydrolase [Alphaproteobacteria bacterium]|nr:dienelactone hydrolase [Alphaproteobacteria bacterium]
MTALTGFTERSFIHDGKNRPVFWRGTGPGVVIMHEIPGITPQVIRFAEFVSEAGFTAVMPQMFGEPGRAISAGYIAKEFARACISHEFSVLAAHKSSPISDWLRALCRSVHTELGGRGVGAIGMCLTGNFALSLMMEPCMMAPVLSQPSLPLPLGKARAAGLHISPDELSNLKRRTAQGDKVLGLRFSKDPACPQARFETLQRELGNGFEAIEIDSKYGNPAGNWIPHSVVTTDLVDEDRHPTRLALDRVIGFFNERLK